MALDPTARESNFRDSIIKFFVDNIETASIPVVFDKGLAQPVIQGQPITIDKWVNVNFGDMDVGTLSYAIVDVVCSSRKDDEGFKLAQLRDTVMGYLTDTTTTDGMKRIPLYRSYASQAWELIGALLIVEVIESQQFVAKDETKFKTMSLDLRWSAKI